MNKQRLAQRTAGVTLAAALGLGIAGPAASAGTAPAERVPAPVAAQSVARPFTPAETAALGQIGFSSREIQELNQISAQRGWPSVVWNVLKRAGKLKSGIKAADKGYAAFKKWLNKIPRPVRWAMRAAGWGGSAWDLYRVMRGW
ncbi:hypothetical protein ACH35V_02500 [Actinomadura sp. 1N219]|uniref:hypothetical protein n=1 Tax=Actinomadura sp. 1N219 TaxID=3375152 RepID=UPI0037A814BD